MRIVLTAFFVVAALPLVIGTLALTLLFAAISETPIYPIDTP